MAFFDEPVSVPFSELAELYNTCKEQRERIEYLKETNTDLGERVERHNNETYWLQREMVNLRNEMRRLTDEIARLRQENKSLMMLTGEYSVRLNSFGTNKIETIKYVWKLLGLGLKETKDIVESAPVELITHISYSSAENIVGALREIGCTAEIIASITDSADASDALANTPA